MPVDQQDREKIEKIIRDRKWAHEKLRDRGSGVYRAFLDMEKAAYGDAALEKKYKELIAIGISVAIDCESCLEWHIREALEAGAAKDQILETIDVGIEMGGGPATVSSRFALKVLDYYSEGKPSS
jgi:AhpD family alkylhydroperoxidase